MVGKEGVHAEPLSQSSLHVCLSLGITGAVVRFVFGVAVAHSSHRVHQQQVGRLHSAVVTAIQQAVLISMQSWLASSGDQCLCIQLCCMYSSNNVRCTHEESAAWHMYDVWAYFGPGVWVLGNSQVLRCERWVSWISKAVVVQERNNFQVSDAASWTSWQATTTRDTYLRCLQQLHEDVCPSFVQ